MNTTYKYFILYISSALIIFSIFNFMDRWYEETSNMQKNILLKEARTLYNDHINTRKWNSMYGGVYVKPLAGQKPNKFLKDAILKVNDKITLFKINPALMSRQLAEISESEDYQINIKGLNPINPKNKLSDFDTRAIQSFKNEDTKEYYEITTNKLKYFGAMQTNKSCIKCHQNQDYKIDTVSGGIEITIDSSQYSTILESMKSKLNMAKIIILSFIFIIVLLIREQIKNNLKLSRDINIKTIEVKSTKKLLQNILDADKSFLLVSDGKDIIFANKTILDFAGFTSLKDFQNKHQRISDKFEKIDDEDFLQAETGGVHWIEYLIKEQNNKNLKVLTKKDGENIYFRPHAKEIKVDDTTLYLITFDNITHEYKTIQELETQALTDPLTGLFNRRKLDDVLKSEIEISSKTSLSLSIIFLDIDHFKVVNDTLGHDVGDSVLKELANIITDTIRKADFVARWGGEEFMIALQSTDLNQAEKLAEKLRINVEEYNFKDADKIKISLGVTEFRNNESEENFIKRVDEALYEAKNTGRNKVVVQ